MSTAAQPGIEMPRYKCHKEVRALKIARIEFLKVAPGWRIIPDDPLYAPVVVTKDYVSKHKPEAGGYFVQYDDGYQSFSPAKAFEEGYTLIESKTVLDARRMCPPGREPLA